MTPQELAAWIEDMAEGCRNRASVAEARHSGSLYPRLVGGYEYLISEAVARLREMGGA